MFLCLTDVVIASPYIRLFADALAGRFSLDQIPGLNDLMAPPRSEKGRSVPVS